MDSGGTATLPPGACVFDGLLERGHQVDGLPRGGQLLGCGYRARLLRGNSLLDSIAVGVALLRQLEPA